MRHKRYHKLTDKQRAKVLQLVEQGIHIRYIAERFDITQTTVNDIVKGAKEKE